MGVEVAQIIRVNRKRERVKIIAHWIGVCANDFTIEGGFDLHTATERVLRLFSHNGERCVRYGSRFRRYYVLELIR